MQSPFPRQKSSAEQSSIEGFAFGEMHALQHLTGLTGTSTGSPDGLAAAREFSNAKIKPPEAAAESGVFAAPHPTAYAAEFRVH